MGCDIHAYIEVREERPLDHIPERFRTTTVVSLIRGVMETRDFSRLALVADALQEADFDDESLLASFREGTWRPPGPWALHDWEKAYHVGELDGDGDPRVDWRRAFEDPLHIGRNYDLFGILADVRNGSGFAGVDTGDGFVPIAAPRGLPADVTAHVAALSERWGVDGHSHSYFTVAELLAYDWTQSTSHRGWVNAEEFLQFQESGRPLSWCGGVSGGSAKHLTNKEMEDRIKNGATQDCYTQVEWGEVYGESARHFLNATLPAMQALGPPENVRLVFWFDN